MNTTQSTTQNTKVVYRCTVKVRKDFWQASDSYDSIEDLLAAIAPWLATRSSTDIHFMSCKVHV